MILYSEQNVYEAAKDRIRKLFSMGDRLGVCFSGGKDSTALLHLTLEVTSELGIQKLPVIFLDQECEYTYTVEYMRYVMSLPEVENLFGCKFRFGYGMRTVVTGLSLGSQGKCGCVRKKMSLLRKTSMESTDLRICLMPSHIITWEGVIYLWEVSVLKSHQLVVLD